MKPGQRPSPRAKTAKQYGKGQTKNGTIPFGTIPFCLTSLARSVHDTMETQPSRILYRNDRSKASTKLHPNQQICSYCNLPFACFLRSTADNKRLRMRMLFGVTSTSSSS